MYRITLTTGDAITGTPNYVTLTHAELRLSDGALVWIERAAIAKQERA